MKGKAAKVRGSPFGFPFLTYSCACRSEFGFVRLPLHKQYGDTGATCSSGALIIVNCDIIANRFSGNQAEETSTSSSATAIGTHCPSLHVVLFSIYVTCMMYAGKGRIVADGLCVYIKYQNMMNHPPPSSMLKKNTVHLLYLQMSEWRLAHA